MKRLLGIASYCVFLLYPFAPAVYGQVRTIFLVRHAEKASGAYDSPLSGQGFQRAKCLADTLADAHIEQIFTSDLQRTQQTVAPLAARLHLKPVAIPITKPGDLVEAIRSGKSTSVLVVWHGGTLPKVLRDLGSPEITPIGESEYDRFFVLTLAANRSQPGFSLLRYCDCTK